MTYETTESGEKITYKGKAAKIRVSSVGQGFGCAASVLVRGKAVAETRTFPHGMTANAYAAALALTDQAEA
jgi:hypothetical protein